MIGLLEVTILSATILAGMVWGLVVLFARQGALTPGSRRAREVVGRAWLYAPLWVPAFLLVAAFLPGLLVAMGVSGDHCLTHDGHHHHLCFVHPPHASDSILSWLLPLLACLPPLTLLAAWARRARRELTMVRTLVGVSRPSHFGPDVRLLDRDEAVAVTVGLRRPTILLSTGLLERISEPTRDVVLAHERAHVARRDTLHAFIERLMASVYPRRIGAALLAPITLAREEACDAVAAASAGGRVVAARALAEVARVGLQAPATGASIASAAVEPRVQRLLAPPRSSHRWVLGALGTTLLLAGAGAGPVHTAAERLITILLH